MYAPKRLNNQTTKPTKRPKTTRLDKKNADAWQKAWKSIKNFLLSAHTRQKGWDAGKKKAKTLLQNVFEYFLHMPLAFFGNLLVITLYKIFFAPFSSFLKAKRLFYLFSFRQLDVRPQTPKRPNNQTNQTTKPTKRPKTTRLEKKTLTLDKKFEKGGKKWNIKNERLRIKIRKLGNDIHVY